ncbi:hypothetical protein [Bacillus coahuilensis]|uniref:hypothetical protein n=1 Tax=Bacillus coahuilensis TaxID=408580 RepID=UPI0012DC0215|nr:hypothetical protein [Bacillus coahuilensis]
MHKVEKRKEKSTAWEEGGAKEEKRREKSAARWERGAERGERKGEERRADRAW